MASTSYIPCPQWRVVNLLQERSVGGDLGRDANWLVGTDEFYKRLFYLGLTVPGSTQEPGAIATRRVKRPPRCARLGARAGSADRAKRCLSEVKLPDRFSVRPKVR
jgi:hypothetical protein